VSSSGERFFLFHRNIKLKAFAGIFYFVCVGCAAQFLLAIAGLNEHRFCFSPRGDFSRAANFSSLPQIKMHADLGAGF